MTIDLRSDIDTYLLLRRGSDVRSGPSIRNNDDSGGSTNSQIATYLHPGAYTIEATTYAPNRAGPFTLQVSGHG